MLEWFLYFPVALSKSQRWKKTYVFLHIGFVHIIALCNYKYRKRILTAYDFNTSSFFIIKNAIPTLNIHLETFLFKLWPKENGIFLNKGSITRMIFKKPPQKFHVVLQNLAYEFLEKNICNVYNKIYNLVYVNISMHMLICFWDRNQTWWRRFSWCNSTNKVTSLREHHSDYTAMQLNYALYGQVNLSWKLTRFPAG